MVAGDPEPDPSASECVNFLDLFDIGAGAPCLGAVWKTENILR